MKRQFSHFACIDWSGQNVARPKGLALAIASADHAPILIKPPNHHFWSRGDICDWMMQRAAEKTDMLIGLDLSLALPFTDKGCYFPEWKDSPADPKSLWTMVDRVSKHDPHFSVQSFLQHPEVSRHFRHSKEYIGDLFGDNPNLRHRGLGRLRQVEHHQRITDHIISRSHSASCFNLVGAAQVGKSSLTAMRVLHHLQNCIPIWPFDPVPNEGPMIIEIYTSIAARAAGIKNGRSKIRDRETLDNALQNLNSPVCQILTKYDDHSTDALITSAWMRKSAFESKYWHPIAMKNEIAAREGWTFGVI